VTPAGLALALAALVLSLPGTPLAGQLVVGMSAAFTGPSRALGLELYRGSLACLEPVNRAGGVNGQRVVIRAYDDRYDPATAIRNTIRLVEDDDVLLLMNYVGTPTVTRVLPLLKSYQKRQVYLFFPFTGAEPHRQPPYFESVFNLRASYREETQGLVDHLVRVGRRRIAVFYQADAYGRGGWEGVRDALAGHGLTMAGEATYRRGTALSASLKAQVDILRAAHPEAIVAIGSYAASAAFIRDARDAGWTVPIANVSFVGSEAMADALRELGERRGVDYTRHLIVSQVVPSPEDVSLPAVREYRRRMDELGGQVPPPGEADYRPIPYSSVSLEGFLNATLLLEILKRMGPGPTKPRIRETVERIRDLDLGIGSPVSFGPTRHQGSGRVYYTTLEGGRVVPLESWGQWAR
jgi:ABC-type branched-subunit amino acid transport system substrate-binding protein